MTNPTPTLTLTEENRALYPRWYLLVKLSRPCREGGTPIRYGSGVRVRNRGSRLRSPSKNRVKIAFQEEQWRAALANSSLAESRQRAEQGGHARISLVELCNPTASTTPRARDGKLRSLPDVSHGFVPGSTLSRSPCPCMRRESQTSRRAQTRGSAFLVHLSSPALPQIHVRFTSKPIVDWCMQARFALLRRHPSRPGQRPR